jgi:hypothetical protein
MVEGGVDDTGRHAFGHHRPQRRFARPATQANPVGVLHPAFLGVVRVDFQDVLCMPDHVGGPAGLGADIVLGQGAAGGQQQREAGADFLVGGDILGDDEVALAANEAGVPSGAASLQGH